MAEMVSPAGPYTLEVAVGTAVSKYTLVKVDSNGQVSTAGATDQVLGVCLNEMPAAAADRVRGNVVSILPISHPGIVRLVAAGAVTMGADLFKAADGKVDDTGTESLGRVAVEAASADGDLILTVPYV